MERKLSKTVRRKRFSWEALNPPILLAMSATIHILALNEASYNPPRKVEQRAMLPPKRCVLSLNQTCSDPPWFAKVITQAKQTMINWMSHLPDNVYTNLYPFPTVYVIFEAWLSAHFDLRNAFDESKSIPCFCNNVVRVCFYNELTKHEGSIWHKQNLNLQHQLIM